MRLNFFYFCLVVQITFCFQIQSQVPNIQWQKSYGGSQRDRAFTICKTNDGGFLIGGGSESSDGDVHNHHSSFAADDFWIIKINDLGNIQWQKCLGGTSGEECYSITQTLDQGFIMAGYTSSQDGDVSGLHGVRDDFWVVKTDSLGNIQWQKCLGGTETDLATHVIQTSDSGYFVVGETESRDGDIAGRNHGAYDIFGVTLNSNGVKQWSKCYGGFDWDDLSTCIQTPDRGFLIAGQTSSWDGDVTGQHNSATSDLWLVKTDSMGTILWQHCYGGSNTEAPYQIMFSYDGYYYIAGGTSSSDGDVSNYYGQSDFWLLKIDSMGMLLWNRCYGGSHFEDLLAACPTSNGGIVMAGVTNVDGGMVSGTHGGLDYWVVNVDSSGNLLWAKALGGTNEDKAYAITESVDGGFVIAGYSTSTDGDVTLNHGMEDYWIVKLAPIGLSVPELQNNIMDLQVLQSKDHFTLRFYSKKNISQEMEVYDVSGRKIFDKNIFINEGINYQTFSMDKFQSGMYLLRVGEMSVRFIVCN